MLKAENRTGHVGADAAGTFCRVLVDAALTTALMLATCMVALAAGDRDNNPPGPRGGPGTNWENLPGPRGGPGTSPDPKPWRPWIWRRIYNAQNAAPAANPWARRRYFQTHQPAVHRPLPRPRHPTGVTRRR